MSGKVREVVGGGAFPQVNVVSVSFYALVGRNLKRAENKDQEEARIPDPPPSLQVAKLFDPSLLGHHGYHPSLFCCCQV